MYSVLFVGDIVAKTGREMLLSSLGDIITKYSPNLVIANGENAAGGLGLDVKTAKEIYDAGVQLITSGNHIWHKKEFIPYLNENSERVIRPINYPSGAPGSGSLIFEDKAKGVTIGVANALGRVFIPDLLSCPFRALDQLLETEFSKANIKFIDFHAEATSEKVAMGHFLDGRVSAVVGTHTHVQTADERILANGTAYISDVGMCGPRDGVIGVEAKYVIDRFITGRPTKFDSAKGAAILNAVYICFDENTGKAISIARIKEEKENSK
jgi:metallophosphoesterase (TIGR00282 family)